MPAVHVDALTDADGVAAGVGLDGDRLEGVDLREDDAHCDTRTERTEEEGLDVSAVVRGHPTESSKIRMVGHAR